MLSFSYFTVCYCDTFRAVHPSLLAFCVSCMVSCTFASTAGPAGTAVLQVLCLATLSLELGVEHWGVWFSACIGCIMRSSKGAGV
jgi:hypothetical protein